MSASGAGAGVAAEAAVKDDQRRHKPGDGGGEKGEYPVGLEAAEQHFGGRVAYDHDGQQPDEDDAGHPLERGARQKAREMVMTSML